VAQGSELRRAAQARSSGDGSRTIKAAGDPDGIADLAAVRERFDEARWTSWNIVRVIASTTAFGLLAWALTLS
jgi:uncharacterized membrane protein